MLLRFTLILPLLLGACASRRDAASGITPSELAVLKKSYYWHMKPAPPNFGDGELERLMDRSTNPRLDGEAAELHTSALAIALATVGDERFAEVLATRSKPVQAAVSRGIRSLWSYHNLSYPKTQAIAATHLN